MWPIRGLATLGAVVLAAPVLAACGASAPSPASLPGTAKQQNCTAVSGVLADGPDPGADSVGYAEAQVLPLKQLKITDPALHQAVNRLAAAYQAFSSSNAASSTAVKVSAAEDAVNALCPKAAP